MLVIGIVIMVVVGECFIECMHARERAVVNLDLSGMKIGDIQISLAVSFTDGRALVDCLVGVIHFANCVSEVLKTTPVGVPVVPAGALFVVGMLTTSGDPKGKASPAPL